MYYFDILHEQGEGNKVELQIGTRANGITFGGEEAADIFQELSEEHVEGLTISGNEPLATRNRPLLTELCKACKEDYPDKNIWCYTDLPFDEIKGLDIMKYIDVLYSQQRVIDVKASRKASEVVLYQ